MDRSTTAETLRVGGREYRIAPLAAAARPGQRLARLPTRCASCSRTCSAGAASPGVTEEGIAALLDWQPKATPSREIAFMPARVLLQDFTGVPAVVDLAAMRDAMQKLGGDARRINPLQPVELVIDHSCRSTSTARRPPFLLNADRELERNRERYAFLRWGQEAFDNFRVVPPDTGIVHQVNLEYLARVVMSEQRQRA
jgi:aconitate hydratase